MEIRVLRYFLEIAREGNMTRAAETLHVTQPTLSTPIVVINVIVWWCRYNGLSCFIIYYSICQIQFVEC